MVICVECAAPVSHIYRRFPSSSQENIRLQRCNACGATADKYVEYECLLLFVELLLHKPQTYRHILFNRLPYADTGLPQPLYRLAAACILFDGYTLWFLLHVGHVRFLFPSPATDEDDGPVAEDGSQQPQQHEAPPPQQQQQQQARQQRFRIIRQHEEALMGSLQGMCRDGHISPVDALSSSDSSSSASSDVERELTPSTSSTLSIYRRCCVSSSSVCGAPDTSSSAPPMRRCKTTLQTGKLLPTPASCSSSADAVGGSEVSCVLTLPEAPAAAPSSSVVYCLPSIVSSALLPDCGVIPQQQDVNNADSRLSSAVTSHSTPHMTLKGLPAAATARIPTAAATAAAATTQDCTIDGASLRFVNRGGGGDHASAARGPPRAQQHRPPRLSSADATDADRHAHMLRWLLHNPLVPADQQLLILSVSVVDFVVYIFAIIFFTDLFLRFTFRRRNLRRQQQQHSRNAVSCYTHTPPQKPPVIHHLHAEAESLHRRDGGYFHALGRSEAAAAAAATRFEGDGDSHQYQKKVLGDTTSRAAEEMRRPQKRRTEEEGLLLQQDRKRWICRARKTDDGENTRQSIQQQQQQREEEGEPTEKTLPTAVFVETEEKEEAKDEEEAEEEGGLTPVEGHAKAETVMGGLSDRGGSGRRSRGKKEEKMTSNGVYARCSSSTCIRWRERVCSFLSSFWKLSWMSSCTAAREILELTFGYGKPEEDFSTEDSGVVLIKYNYLAAAVTLSMFGKLGTLILMAWEESLSPRCFTCLFTFTSNVLAVDVFLNGQHHTAAAVITTAAAAVRALARLAQQLIFPFLAFPPCTLSDGNTPPGTHQFTSLVVNYLSLLV